MRKRKTETRFGFIDVRIVGRWSGSVVEALGFEHFFWLVVGLGLVGILTLLFLPQPEAPHAETKLQS